MPGDVRTTGATLNMLIALSAISIHNRAYSMTLFCHRFLAYAGEYVFRSSRTRQPTRHMLSDDK